jgi:hypothetical protein
VKTTYTLLEYMPVHLRSSHIAAGNSGRYPTNGAERVYVCDIEVQSRWLDSRWAEVIEDCISETDLPEDCHTVYDIPSEALAYVPDPDDQEWDDPMMGGQDYGH